MGHGTARSIALLPRRSTTSMNYTHTHTRTHAHALVVTS